jgi:hypothetical protein
MLLDCSHGWAMLTCFEQVHRIVHQLAEFVARILVARLFRHHHMEQVRGQSRTHKKVHFNTFPTIDCVHHLDSCWYVT